MVEGIRFGLQGSGELSCKIRRCTVFRVCGVEFEDLVVNVQILGFQVEGFRFKIQGLGFRVQGSGFAFGITVQGCDALGSWYKFGVCGAKKFPGPHTLTWNYR